MKPVARLESCVSPRTAKRLKGGGSRIKHHQHDFTLYEWFRARRAQNEPVSTRLLNHEAQRLAQPDGHVLSRRWLEKFHRRHHIVVTKAQCQTQLTTANRNALSQKFCAYLYLQPSSTRAWVGLDEIPASLARLLGGMHTLPHMGATNVMLSFDDGNFKRIGASIAILGTNGRWIPQCATQACSVV